jgi:uncharacterized protein
MEETTTFKVGAIISTDLTVPNAEEVHDFYKQVIGWGHDEMPMSDEQGEYADYVMKDEAGDWVGGVCHKRGGNADLPHQWLVYINVASVEDSTQKCEALGGKVLKKSYRDDGLMQYAVIEDPYGAILAVTRTS